MKSVPCNPCKTILGPWVVWITWAVTHFITVPGGWLTNKEASKLPGAGASIGFTTGEATDVLAVVVLVTFEEFKVSVDTDWVIWVDAFVTVFVDALAVETSVIGKVFSDPELLELAGVCWSTTNY